MNVILLSGGSGKRLWPLSNDVRSKQFIPIFERADGSRESMAQRVYRQIRKIDADALVVVAAPKPQVSELRTQLGAQLDISVEPCRRDTFPAITLACAYLHDVKGVPETEPILICPVDSYVDDSYFETLKALSRLAAEGTANLVLMGIQPTYPSEKYGYILPETTEAVSRVRSFREKPDRENAEKYIAQGALWNGGVFACRLEYILGKAGVQIGFSGYYDLFSKYETLPKISFDYAVVEKEPSIQVVRYAGEWKDLGTWNTLTEAIKRPVVGNAVLDKTCSNTHVINDLDIPVLAMGLRGVVVAASPQGILVADKEQSSYMKPLVDTFDQSVMFAEKSWGSYRVLDAQPESLTVRVTLRPGHRMNYHSHERRDEVWVVVSGTGRTIVDGMEQEVHVGDVIAVQAGCRHTVMAVTDLVLMEVQLGREISVDDKQKYPLEL